ncbi:hypothetical protein RF11_14426 [Thelohanellus kitauei]|uniref:Integrase catalytic domain-containing protein n=1 Tax=Thelohanellus kitauei TaxID=669202 RepID=A0A0C2MLM8_THEKT|nr:hypothetical protein RF11_14426 [Thelohanellus kitauei]
MLEGKELGRLWSLKNINKRSFTGFKPEVPTHLKGDIFELAHTQCLSCLGTHKTVEFIKDRYNWKNLNKDISFWVSKCDGCNRNKAKNYAPKALLQPFDSTKPYSRWHLDFTERLPISKDGNRFIIVALDAFTKWVQAKPVVNQTDESVANFLLDNIVCRFGLPEQVHTDMGTQFESTLIAHLCKLLKINKPHTTPYRPSGNGHVERSNRTIKEALRGYLNDFKNDWDEYLHLDPKSIIYTKLIPCPVNENFENYHVYVQKLINAIKLQDKITAECLRSSKERQKYYHDASYSNFICCPGKRVFMPTRNQEKFDEKFDGSFIIEQEKYPYYIISTSQLAASKKQERGRIGKRKHESPNSGKSRRERRAAMRWYIDFERREWNVT